MKARRGRFGSRLCAALLCAAVLVLAVPGRALAQSGAVRGVVMDTDGRPIRGASVKAAASQGNRPEITATTDAKGRFGMIGLTGGVWLFVVEAPGFLQGNGRSFVRSTVTDNAPLEFVLGRAAAPVPTALTRQVDSELAAADALRAEGKLGQAIAAYQAIAEKNPALTSVQLVIGDAWRQQAGKETGAARDVSLDRALAAFDVILNAEPEHDRARIESALTWLVKGDAARAESLVAGGALAGASPELVLALAEVRFSKGDLGGAEQLFKRAAGMDAAWLRPRVRLGLLVLRRGDTSAAAGIFRAVAAASPGSPEAAEAERYLNDIPK